MAAGLLDGLEVGRCGYGAAGEVCNWLLEGLGASVTASAPAPALVRSTVPIPSGGLPPGTIDYATGAALAIATLAGLRSEEMLTCSETAVAVQVWLPDVMAAAYASPAAMTPAPPLKAPGEGWVAADLGAFGDRETFDRLVGTLPKNAGAAKLAAAAQSWRLPVCDYRPFRAPPLRHPVWVGCVEPVGSRRFRGARPLEGIQICDMTAMWAGPLATWLLAGLGAKVFKVEPAFRPDGFRALDGGGIHPQGQQVEPGNDSAMWNALNSGKVRLPLDLRDRSDRDDFVELARQCDVLIESFSPRVMPNFGVLEEIAQGPARPAVISMPAFPEGPERTWVAYGTGVHAVLGLGDRGDGTFEAPPVSYPDPLAGLVAALAVTASVVGRDLGRHAGRMEVALAAASRPLASIWAAAGRALPGGGSEELFDAARIEGLMECRQLAGLDLLHPAPLFR
jgi:hypothetical protein